MPDREPLSASSWQCRQVGGRPLPPGPLRGRGDLPASGEACQNRAVTMTSTVVRIEATTIGEAWLRIAAAILGGGAAGSWEGRPIVEVLLATIDVSSPSADDPIIARLGDPERLANHRPADAVFLAQFALARDLVSRLPLAGADSPPQLGQKQRVPGGCTDERPPFNVSHRPENNTIDPSGGYW